MTLHIVSIYVLSKHLLYTKPIVPGVNVYCVCVCTSVGARDNVWMKYRATITAKSRVDGYKITK